MKDSKFEIQNFGLCIVILIFALCTLHFLTGCGRRAPREMVTKLPVSAVEVKRGSLKGTLFYVGDVKAKDEAIVYPKVTGKIIEKLAKEGDSIKKGDCLAYIDRDEIGFQFEKAPVESPIDGVVGMVYVDIGASVSSQEPVGLVVNMDTVKVKINVVERDLPKIRKGQIAQIEVDAYPEETFGGVVERVSPVVDLTSRTALVEIEIPNPEHRLKPGMFARMNILVEEKKGALIIPRDAIVKVNSSNCVFVIDSNNKVHQRKIELGLHENNKFEVIKGLNEGELVVTMGNIRLKEGDIVEVIK